MKRVLYVGLDAPTRTDVQVIHHPLIRVIPRITPEISKMLLCLPLSCPIIVTSKSTVRCFQDLKMPFEFYQMQFLSVGKATTMSLQKAGASNILTATNECQEGIIELIQEQKIAGPFFWGHSNLSRPLLLEYLGASLTVCILYDTVMQKPDALLDLEAIDEVHFSSPSCVDAFFHFYGLPPDRLAISTQGHVTRQRFDERAVTL